MSAGKLPEGWVPCKLEDTLLKIVGGGTPSKTIPEYYQGDIPWMSVKDMNKHTLTDTVDHITPDAVKNSSTNIIPAGIPIIATRMSLGKIVTASFDSAINQDLKALFLTNDIERNFFLHWYRSQAQLIGSLGTGTTVKGIRLEVLNSLSMNLPPLAEQKIIAEKLDTLLAQVDSTKARLEQILKIVKTYRQAVFSAAINGKLTNVEVKLIGKLGDISSIISGVAFKKSQYSASGYRLFQIANVAYGKTCWDNFSFISNALAKQHSDFILKESDIVLALNRPITNSQLKVAEISPTDLPSILYQRVARLRVKEKNNFISSDYLFFVMQAPSFLKKVEENLKGSDQPYLNTSLLCEFPIFSPSLHEQHEIVRRVEQLFSYADTIEKQVNNALARVNNLTQSILAKAFRGELTAQWRAENPELISGENSAAALLEKIKAERAASSGKKASRKKS